MFDNHFVVYFITLKIKSTNTTFAHVFLPYVITIPRSKSNFKNLFCFLNLTNSSKVFLKKSEKHTQKKL